jgi:cell division protein FtsB
MYRRLMEIKPVNLFNVSQIYSTVSAMEQELILLRSANAAYEKANEELREKIAKLEQDLKDREDA